MHLKSVAAFLLNPLAWVASAAMVAGLGWYLGHSAYGWGIAGGIGVFVFAAFAGIAGLRRRAEGLARDLTFARRAKDLAQRTLDRVPALAWRSDLDGNRSYVSPGWLALTGQSLEEAVNQGWREAVHEDDRETYASALRLATANQGPFEVEYRVRAADGSDRWALDVAALERDDDGASVGFVGATVDLTDRRESDDDITHGQQLNLHRSINARAVQLADRLEALEEKKEQAEYAARVKFEFLAALGQQLREPVAEIKAVMKMLLASDLDETRTEYARRAELAAGGLERLLRRADDLKSLADQDEALDITDFNLRRLVDLVFETQKPLAEKRGVVINCDQGKTVPALVKSDALAIRRVQMELWRAGLDLATTGRLILRVSCDQKNGIDCDVRFALTLTGETIDPEVIECAFYPAESIGGEIAGLGLGPCRDVTERLGGRMGVQAGEDGSLVLWCTLPVKEQDFNCDGQRAHGRLSQEELKCNLGPVLDLSMGGLRLRTPKPLEGNVDVELDDDEETISLRAEVAWCRRLGFGKHEAGLRFIDIDPESASRLSRLATRNRLRRVLEAA